MTLTHLFKGTAGKAFCLAATFTCLTIFGTTASARDTDIYDVTSQQNCYVHMDNSGSMAWHLYHYSINFGDMYDYLYTLNDAGNNTYIYHPKATHKSTDPFTYLWQNHLDRDKIYLIKGSTGLSINTVDGKSVGFTGDTGNPRVEWVFSSLIDTGTTLDSSGNISGGRLTLDGNNHILFDGSKLPIDSQDKKLHDVQNLYGGAGIDNGFGGLLLAPGYHFSGYNSVTNIVGSAQKANDGDTDIYFFATGNWLSMMAITELEYVDRNPPPNGPKPKYSWDPAPVWPYESFPLSQGSGLELSFSGQFPASGTYSNKINYGDNGTVIEVPHSTAKQIEIHFSAMDVESKTNGTCNDHVGLFDEKDTLISEYCDATLPADGWSAPIPGEKVVVKFRSNNSQTGTGYAIDKIRVTYFSGDYKIESRMEIAKDAMKGVVTNYAGKIKWGYTTFNYTSSYGDGARIESDLENSLNTTLVHIEGTYPEKGTPLGEALQDIWLKGFWTKRGKFDSDCQKNYVIMMTDGYPTFDNEWDRIAQGSDKVTITDADNDNWTSDPSLSPVIDNYYDDVAHWMYTHDFKHADTIKNPGAHEISDPANSYNNVTTHHVAFGANHPLLEDAAGDSGGLYIAAYNKAQLIAAFDALAMEMAEAVSFTAPVVSVDSQNKIQNGEDLYLGLFLPQGNESWVGNLKKFKLGDGSADRPGIWMIYDGANNEAITSQGEFKDNLSAFWADDNDLNDSDNYGAADVREDGVGEVLAERVALNYSSTDYYDRDIFTYLGGAGGGSLAAFNRSTTDITNLLNVSDDATKNALVNYVYGYTNAAAASGDPITPRPWNLGAIIHSSPVVVDYYQTTDLSVLLHRYIVVGANDGMLHVFDDTDPTDGAYGHEIFAFIPPDILPKLQQLPVTPLVDTVDGDITVYRRDKEPKYLIFGERRGGDKYWALDISNPNPLLWDVAWSYTNSEIKESWSEVSVASIPIGLNASGAPLLKDVAIFTGGYDPEEDNYPEPFLDIDQNGTPFDPKTGNIDTSEWDSGDVSQDINSNGNYDKYNLDKNEYGRGIYVVDIDDPTNTVGSILPFSVTYDATTNTTTGSTQTLTGMKYSFPASPSIVTATHHFLHKKIVGSTTHIVTATETNILNAIYATDVYANLYRVTFDFGIEIGNQIDPDFANWTWNATPEWTVNKIFSSNPGSNNVSGTYGGSDDASDPKRKAFYSPAISWGGSCKYFDRGNYIPLDSITSFKGTNSIASLFYGTGDREHPTYTMIRNRMYAIYDDSTVYGEQVGNPADPDVIVETAPYTEKDLLNLSCDELDIDVEVDATAGTTSDEEKDALKEGITDDATYDKLGILTYEQGTEEEDAKGWYIILEDQGDPTACSHCTYPVAISDATKSARDNHDGEKILSQPVLYAGVLYFTSYQPAADDPCYPMGNGLAYSLNYCDATAAYNLNEGNDGGSSNGKYDVTDRYKKYAGILGIPSGFAVVTRNGEAGAMAMMGNKIIGPKGPDDFTIKGPGMGLELYYWREGNSLDPNP